MNKFLLFHVLFISLIIGVCEGKDLDGEYFKNNETIRQYFSSYKPYEPLSREYQELILSKSKENEREKAKIIDSKCTLKQIQYYGRHAQRYPFYETMNSFKNLYGSISAAVKRNSDYIEYPEWLTTWNLEFLQSLSPGDISIDGQMEIYQISKRIKQKYASLFDFQKSSYNFPSNWYRFQTTQYPHSFRTISTLAFGIFEGTGVLPSSHFNTTNATPDRNEKYENFRWKNTFQPVFIESSDEITKRLKPYIALKDQCSAISSYQQKIDSQKPQIGEFFTSISTRLSKQWRFSISSTHIKFLFYLCIFEANLEKRYDGFCSLFSIEEFKLFELWMDSDLYYNSGEGMLPNVRAASIELQEIYGLMLNAAKSTSTAQKSVIKISHHQSFLTLLSLLGICNDGMSPTDFQDGDRNNRLWKTSEISSYSANLIFHLYSCNSQKASEIEEGLYVKLTLNEMDISLPDQPIYLLFNNFWNQLQLQLNYTFDSICSSLSTPSQITHPFASATKTPHVEYSNRIDIDNDNNEVVIIDTYHNMKGENNNNGTSNIQIQEIHFSSILLWVITGIMFGFISGYLFSTRQQRRR